MNGTSSLEAVLRLGEGGLTATQKRETASHGTIMLVFVFSIKYTKLTEVCYNSVLKIVIKCIYLVAEFRNQYPNVEFYMRVHWAKVLADNFDTTEEIFGGVARRQSQNFGSGIL